MSGIIGTNDKDSQCSKYCVAVAGDVAPRLFCQNLAIGTICASGSLGTMIPPSIGFGIMLRIGIIAETAGPQCFCRRAECADGINAWRG